MKELSHNYLTSVLTFKYENNLENLIHVKPAILSIKYNDNYDHNKRS